MGQELASKTKRCETRYTISECEATRVTVVITGEHGEERHEGFLADLSSSGVRFALAVQIPQGLPVQFFLSVDKIQLRMHSDAVVRWLQPRDGDSWWVGCELLEVIPDDVIEALATAKLLDRRRDPRYPIDHPAIAKWELTDEQLDVQVVDYSKGGFCMLCKEAKHFPSERVMLLISNGDCTVKVSARVMWQRQLDHGYAVGCSFTTLDAFVTFRDVVEPGRSGQRQRRLGKSRSMSFRRWVVIAVFVLLTVRGLELIRDRESARKPLGQAVIQSFVETVQSSLLGKSASDEKQSSDRG